MFQTAYTGSFFLLPVIYICELVDEATISLKLLGGKLAPKLIFFVPKWELLRLL